MKLPTQRRTVLCCSWDTVVLSESFTGSQEALYVRHHRSQDLYFSDILLLFIWISWQCVWLKRDGMGSHIMDSPDWLSGCHGSFGLNGPGNHSGLEPEFTHHSSCVYVCLCVWEIYIYRLQPVRDWGRLFARINWNRERPCLCVRWEVWRLQMFECVCVLANSLSWEDWDRVIWR